MYERAVSGQDVVRELVEDRGGTRSAGGVVHGDGAARPSAKESVKR